MSIGVFAPGLGFYVGRIEARQPFTFVRMGDGEWSTILQDRTRTSSKSQHIDIPKLKRLMRTMMVECPKDPRFVISMRPGSQRPGIETWLERNARTNIKWHDCRVLYQASKHGNLYPWVKAVRECGLPVVVVGPERHKTLNGRMFDIAQHVVIPNRDCFVEQDRILAEVCLPNRPAVILFSAGPAAKVMCWQLWKRGVGESSFVFDVGSLLDVYCVPMKKSRKYHKYLANNPELIRRNLTGE